MAAADNRKFHYALAASLALHALLLFSFPDLVDTARRAASLPPQIIARLMEPAPEPAPAPPPPLPPVEPEKKPVAKKEPAPPKETPKPPPVLSAPKPAPIPAPPVEVAPAVPAPPPVVAAAPKPAAPAPSAPVAPAPAQVSESLSRDQYRLLLIEEANRHKRYPPIARENNWVGRSHVVVAVAPDGRTSVTLKASSGHQVLDQLAVNMFTRATREVPVPSALRGKPIVLDLPIRFELEN